MICPNCNNEIDNNSNFCRFCGSNVEIVENKSTINLMYCPKCGRALALNSRFCSFCGTKIKQIISENSVNDYLNSAKDEFNDNNYEKSLELFINAYDLDNNDKNALYGIIKSFFELKEYGKVIVYSQKYLKIDGNNEKILNYKLISEMNINSYLAANKTINDLLNISKNDINLLYKKIDILKEIDETDELIKVFDEILAIDPNNDNIYFEKAKFLFDLSEYDESLKLINNALNINQLNEYEEFKTTVEKTLVNNIDEKSYEKALNYFNEHNYYLTNQILINFTDIKSLKLRCMSLYFLGKNEDALTLIKFLLSKERNHYFLNLKGKIYLAMNDKENSIFYLNESYILNKNYSVDLAFAYGVFGEIEFSKKYYSERKNAISDLWISYFNNKEDLYISGIDYDYFNFPHACCLKMESYFKKFILIFEDYNQNKSIIGENILKKLLHLLNLVEKYFNEFKDCINYYNLQRRFIISNFVYLHKLFINYLYFNDYNLSELYPQISKKLCNILSDLLKYYSKKDLENIFKPTVLTVFYKTIGKLYLSAGLRDLALKYFRLASNYNFNDGEVWLFIGNLSNDDGYEYFNKALFCFSKIDSFDDVTLVKFKSLSLYNMNRTYEALNLLKTVYSNDLNELNDYLFNLNEEYSG